MEKNNENYYFIPDYDAMIKKRKIKIEVLAIALIILSCGLAILPIFLFFYSDIFEEKEELYRGYYLRSLIYFSNLSLQTRTNLVKIEKIEGFPSSLNMPNGGHFYTIHSGFIGSSIVFCGGKLSIKDKILHEVHNQIADNFFARKEIKRI